MTVCKHEYIMSLLSIAQNFIISLWYKLLYEWICLDVYQRVGRDGADAQYMQYLLKQKPYNFTTTTLKAYLSA